MNKLVSVGIAVVLIGLAACTPKTPVVTPNETTNQTQPYPSATYVLNVIVNPPEGGNVTVSPTGIGNVTAGTLMGSISVVGPRGGLDEFVTLPGGGKVEVGHPYSGTLSVSASPYASGTNVTLIATPAPGYIVAYFLGGAGLAVWNPNALMVSEPASFNTSIDSDTYISVVFFSRQSFWDEASLYTTTSIPGAFSIPTAGDYFYVSVPNRAGASWEASYNESLIALIDTQNIGGSSGNSEFLFRALAPGQTQIAISGFSENMTYLFVIVPSPLPPP